MEFPFAKGSEEYDYDAIKMMPEKQALKSISLTDGKVVDNQDYKAPLGINAFEYADQITMTLPLSAKETMFHSVSFWISTILILQPRIITQPTPRSVII